MLSVLVLIGVAAIGAVAGAAPAFAGCGDNFPDTEWRVTGETELLVVATAPSVSDGQGLRFADEASATARWLEEDLGTIPQLNLCIFGVDDDLDPTGLVPAGQLLHAVVFNEDATVYVNTIQASLFDETHAFGLAYAALWHVADELGRTGYPEPLASAVGQWYLARSADKLDLHHVQMRGGAFFRDPSGGGIETTDWAQASQPPTFAWNPQFHETPISDLVQFAVDQYGPEILNELDGIRWSEIEQEWQTALRLEALQGSSGGADWVVGLVIFFGFIGLAGLTAWLTRRSRIKLREEARKRAEAEAAGVSAPADAAAARSTPRAD